ncbi:MAG: SOS response-associated peptidase [Ruminococcus sp.]|jgi:putative SOS response-associated peptidase YedK|nr:SOS response-associated peptidase [Ruminococcus sp.]
MCGRYYIEISDEELREISKSAQNRAELSYRDMSVEMKKEGEIYPSNVVPVITSDGIFPMKWGFEMAGKKLLINARFETWGSKQTYKNCKLCLVPASGYYEWKADTDPKVKFKFYLEGQSLFLAGLYRQKDDDIPKFVILTREAVGEAAEIHHRMPVILPSKVVPEKLDYSDMITDLTITEADRPTGQISFDII